MYFGTECYDSQASATTSVYSRPARRFASTGNRRPTGSTNRAASPLRKRGADARTRTAQFSFLPVESPAVSSIRPGRHHTVAAVTDTGQIETTTINLGRLRAYEEEAEATRAELAELRKRERALTAALK